MAELSMSPPDQDSPKHILNVLNDKCIQAIFNQLISNLEDFSSASEVCKRFQQNAVIYYSESGEKRIAITAYQHANLPSGTVSFGRAHGFLKIFGRFLESIYLISIRDEEYLLDENYTVDQKPINVVLNSIADFCGNTLTKLTAHAGYIDLNTSSPFTALEKLDLASGIVYDVAPFPEAKVLEVRSCKILRDDVFGRTFPKLEKAVFCSIKGLTDDAFISFQTCNPQLQKLWLLCLDPNVGITSAIVRDIELRTPNLTDFTLICNRDESLMNNLGADILHLSGLKQLRNLRVECNSAPFSAKLLIEAFAENDVPIEDLQIHGANPDYVESLSQLQQLKRLNILNVPEDMVAKCVRNSHGLQELIIEGDVTIDGVIQILKQRRLKLNKLYVTANGMKIDQENYDKVLALAKNACMVSIICYDGSLDVKRDVLMLNSQWLHFFMTSR